MSKTEQDKASCGKPHLAVTSPGSAGQFSSENTGFSLGMAQRPKVL